MYTYGYGQVYVYSRVYVLMGDDVLTCLDRYSYMYKVWICLKKCEGGSSGQIWGCVCYVSHWVDIHSYAWMDLFGWSKPTTSHEVII